MSSVNNFNADYGHRVSYKNTFINVDDDSEECPAMPDLMRARTTPEVLQAIREIEASTKISNTLPPMTTVHEEWPSGPTSMSTFDASAFLRELSALSGLRYESSASTNSDMMGFLSLAQATSAYSADSTAATSAGNLSAVTSPNAQIDLGVPNGLDVNGTSLTTVMLRNIPNKYDSPSLLGEVNAHGFIGKYDFFYLPIDFRNKCNVGYAFVNFRMNTDAIEFITAFHNYRLPAVNSTKVCQVCWAKVQGKEENIAHYRNSPIAPEYRPLLFRTDGTLEAFPSPDPSVQEAIELCKTESARQSQATKGPDSNKIFVGGLAKGTTGDKIREYFAKFGAVRDAAVVVDRTSGKSRGFGFCLFEAPVPQAVLNLKHSIEGNPVSVKLYSQKK